MTTRTRIHVVSWNMGGPGGGRARHPVHRARTEERWGSLIFGPTLAIEAFSLPEDSSLRALPKYLDFAQAPRPDGAQAITASIHAPPRRAEGSST